MIPAKKMATASVKRVGLSVQMGMWRIVTATIQIPPIHPMIFEATLTIDCDDGRIIDEKLMIDAEAPDEAVTQLINYLRKNVPRRIRSVTSPRPVAQPHDLNPALFV